MGCGGVYLVCACGFRRHEKMGLRRRQIEYGQNRTHFASGVTFFVDAHMLARPKQLVPRYVEQLETLKSQEKTITRNAQVVEQMYALLAQYDVKAPSEDMVQVDDLRTIQVTTQPAPLLKRPLYVCAYKCNAEIFNHRPQRDRAFFRFCR